MKGLFDPSRIAILGARDEPSDAANLYRSIKAAGFEGEVILVNPSHAELFGQPCLSSLEDADGEIDLAIVLVGSAAATDIAVSDSVRKGARLVQVYGSFGPTSPVGAGSASRQPRILGPSSLGFANIPGKTSTLVVHPENFPSVRGGRVRITGQSGGLLLAAAEYGRVIGLGLELIVSTGAEVDLTALEIATDALSEVDLTAVGLILEGVRSPRALRDFLEAAAMSPVPVVVLKLGRSEPGAVQAETHSQNVAGPADVFDDLCSQHGVLVTRSIRNFTEVLRLLEAGFGHSAEGVAYLGLSGGLRVLISDVVDSHRMEPTAFDDSVVARVEELVGPSGAQNPVDLGAVALQAPQLIGQVVEALIGDANTGVLALVTHLRASGGSPAYQALISEFLAHSEEAHRQGKRLVVISTSPSGIGGENWQRCTEAGVPVLSDISSIGNLGLAMSHHRSSILLQERTATATGGLLSKSGQKPAVEDVLESLAGDGVRVARWRIATGRDDALDAAVELGYPVVLKVSSPELLHKSEIGGVILDIRDEEALASGFDRLTAGVARSGHSPTATVIVQEMVYGEVELMVGTSLQREFGRIITLAIGGIHVDFIDDAVHAFGPFDESHALRMLAALRSQHLLDGVRGGTAVNRSDVASLLSAFSIVSADLPEQVTSLELNPVICTDQGPVAVDLAMLLADE